MNWHSLTSSPEVLGFVQFQYQGGEGGEGGSLMSISVSWFQVPSLWTHALNDMCMYVCLDLGTVHCFLFRFTGYVLHTSICNYHEVSVWLKLHIRAYVGHGIRFGCCFSLLSPFSCAVMSCSCKLTVITSLSAPDLLFHDPPSHFVFTSS